MDILDLDLSCRAINCLKRAHINNVEDIPLLIPSVDDLLRVRNMGLKARYEIIDTLEKNGFFYFRPLSEEEVDQLASKPVTSLPLDTQTLNKLQTAGLIKISDIMYELVTDLDIIRIGLTSEEAELIINALKSKQLHLGISHESFYNVALNSELICLLKDNVGSAISDILIIGFDALIDRIGYSNAIAVASCIKMSGYLLMGYNGLKDPQTCAKLKDYFLGQSLEYLKLDDNVMEQLHLLDYNFKSIADLVKHDIRFLYHLCPDYDMWVKISEKLKTLQLDIPGIDQFVPGEKNSTSENPLLEQDIEKLSLPSRILIGLQKHGITTVGQLTQQSAACLLDDKVVSLAGLATIRKALDSQSLFLNGDHKIKCTQCKKWFIGNTSAPLCDNCTAKRKRISKIKKLDVTISGPFYRNSSDSQPGFSLFANFKNTSYDLMSLALINFYLVEYDRQISPKCFLEGYEFDYEYILPETARSCGKIWETERCSSNTRLENGTQAIITLRMASENFQRMYKFLYDFKINSWTLDDYFEV